MVGAISLLKKDRALALYLIRRSIRVSEEEAAIGYDYYLAKHSEGILYLPTAAASISLSRKPPNTILMLQDKDPNRSSCLIRQFSTSPRRAVLWNE